MVLASLTDEKFQSLINEVFHANFAQFYGSENLVANGSFPNSKALLQFYKQFNFNGLNSSPTWFKINDLYDKLGSPLSDIEKKQQLGQDELET
ncbi:CLUMA_CG005206, isoform A [Clunio marinus]|uniref:CLUMA_CG005206, isoform A n=1 Tax=Clunio marinus TaxID=568069 RepID=A0A1J1HU70_9DIPT|nr:CLUMA_CG005206, isoform A [Clunio marinus]